ncbi:MAG: amidohydrolase family protein [Hyphomonadaceae bacterium]
MSGFLIRNAELSAGARPCDVRMANGVIVDIGQGLSDDEAIDARGAALIPGLADHHIHLLSLAAREASLDVEGAVGADAFAARLRDYAAERAPGGWLRVIGYHERIAGPLARAELDALAPSHKLRVQHQSGILWMLNSEALSAVLREEMPDCVERDGEGRPTGRIWRGDAWLKSRISSTPPDLAALGARLASLGVTALTDATVTTTDVEARLIASAGMPQRLRLMSGGVLTAPDDDGFQIGEVKLLLDEATLPDLDVIGRKIAFAREQGRALAVHCVTAIELAYALAAFEAFGAPAGTRIEHGSVIPQSAIASVRALGLSVITQPGLIHRRGDRYLAETPPEERGDLYRCASLLAAAVPVAFSSDAPYGPANPWEAIAAAAHRRTQGGQPFGPSERIAATDALRLHSGALERPFAPRAIALGEAADMCLLHAPIAEALAAPSGANVRATIINGEIVYGA